MDSLRFASTKDLKKSYNALGSTHAGTTGVLSFELGRGRLVL